MVRETTDRVAFESMTVVNKQRAMPDLWGRYGQLDAAHRTVMQLKALAWLPSNMTAFLSCLTRTGLRGPDPQPLHSSGVSQGLGEHEKIPCSTRRDHNDPGGGGAKAVRSARPGRREVGQTITSGDTQDRVIGLTRRVFEGGSDVPGFQQRVVR